MIAKETINGIITEAKQAISKNDGSFVLLEPNFAIILMDEYRAVRNDNDVKTQQLTAIKEIVGG